jgi:predicted phage terminase large subunit-like protein
MSQKKSTPPSSDERRAVLKSAATNDLISFSQILDPKYSPNWHHETIAQKLEEARRKVEAGIPARIILEVPPRHGKSELATIKFPAQTLGIHPEWPIIVSSYSAELAEDFGLKTRDTLNHEHYRALFTSSLRPDTQARGRWLTHEGGGYTATGVGGAITGRGFKVGIIDDPFKNREEADSEVIREKVWNWYTSTFYTRQEGISAIIVICTRWHLDDLVGRLLEQQEAAEKAGLAQYDRWEVIRFPAIADQDETHRKVGEALWPEKFPLPILENIRNTVGVYDWSSLYQQEPILAENAEFRQEWFRYFEEKDLAGKNLRYTTTVDLAVSEKTSADNTVIRTVAKEPDRPNWYLVEETAGHLDPLQTIDAIFYHQQKYRSEVFLETVAYQKALKYFLEEEQRRRQTYFLVNELKRNTATNKETRIRGLVPLYKAGVIFHRRSDVELERELLQFPKGKHDDRADALASQLEAVENTAQKTKPYQQPAWEAETSYFN